MATTRLRASKTTSHRRAVMVQTLDRVEVAKSAPTTITMKAVDPAASDPAGTGEFEALVSVFGNTDSYGDIVEKGAFRETLADWSVKGAPIPVVWSHDLTDPDSIIGKIVSAEETDQGLRIKGLLDLNHPKAARVHQLMRDGLIREFSWSGIVTDSEPVEKSGDDIADLFGPMRIKSVDLWEAGPCFKGANPDTELLAVKARQVAKAGRVLSKPNLEAIQDAYDRLGEVIDKAKAAEGDDEDDGDEDGPASSGAEKSSSTPEPSQEPVVERASASDIKARLLAAATN
jgi:HK97 family phage prohead protease